MKRPYGHHSLVVVDRDLPVPGKLEPKLTPGSNSSLLLKHGSVDQQGGQAEVLETTFAPPAKPHWHYGLDLRAELLNSWKPPQAGSLQR